MPLMGVRLSPTTTCAGFVSDKGAPEKLGVPNGMLSLLVFRPVEHQIFSWSGCKNDNAVLGEM